MILFIRFHCIFHLMLLAFKPHIIGLLVFTWSIGIAPDLIRYSFWLYCNALTLQPISIDLIDLFHLIKLISCDMVGDGTRWMGWFATKFWLDKTNEHITQSMYICTFLTSTKDMCRRMMSNISLQLDAKLKWLSVQKIDFLVQNSLRLV